MSVKAQRVGNVLELTLSGGDRDKFEQAIKEWRFKDEQSLLRFCVSVLLSTNDKSIAYIDADYDGLRHVVPADHLIKEGKRCSSG